MEYSNPARRLHTILEAGRQFNHKEPCIEVWSKILGTDTKGPQLLRRLAKVMMLPREIIEICERNYPARKGVHRQWSDNVEAGFRSQQLSGQWQTFYAHISSATLDFLAITSDLIQGSNPEDDSDEDGLQRAKIELSELFEEIIKSDLPKNVKEYLLRALSGIISAIDEYRISGSTAIMDSVDSTLGHVVHDTQYRAVMKETSIGQRVLSVLDGLASITSTAAGLVTIAGSIKTFISSNG